MLPLRCLMGPESAAINQRSTAAPDFRWRSGAVLSIRLTGRGGGIRTHGLFVPNEARYQAAPHPVEAWPEYRTGPSAGQTRCSASRAARPRDVDHRAAWDESD